MSTAEDIKQFLVEYADNRRWAAYDDIQSKVVEEMKSANEDFMEVMKYTANLVDIHNIYIAVNLGPYPQHFKEMLLQVLAPTLDMLTDLKNDSKAKYDEHVAKAQELISQGRVREATADGATAENTELLKCMEDVSGRLELREDVAQRRGMIYEKHSENQGQHQVYDQFVRWFHESFVDSPWGESYLGNTQEVTPKKNTRTCLE